MFAAAAIHTAIYFKRLDMFIYDWDQCVIVCAVITYISMYNEIVLYGDLDIVSGFS